MTGRRVDCTLRGVTHSTVRGENVSMEEMRNTFVVL